MTVTVRYVVRRGRFHWLVYDADGRFLATGTVKGFKSRAGAVRDIQRLLGISAIVEKSD